MREAEETESIVLYLEGIRGARRFMSALRNAGMQEIVAGKTTGKDLAAKVQALIK